MTAHFVNIVLAQAACAGGLRLAHRPSSTSLVPRLCKVRMSSGSVRGAATNCPGVLLGAAVVGTAWFGRTGHVRCPPSRLVLLGGLGRPAID